MAIVLQQYLANTGALAYGCMGLGGHWDRNPVSQEHINQAHQVIDTNLDLGINLFDHADIYTFGKAEQAFGMVLQQRPELREQIYIQSKCGIRFADEYGPKRYDFSKQWLTHSLDGILKRLQTDYLDMLLLHRPDPLLELDELATCLEQFKSSGKVRYFGVSNMHAQQISYLQSALDAPLVSNQLEMSLAKLDFVESGIVTGNSAVSAVNFAPGTIEYCQQHNIQLQAWGSLAQGLFSGRNLDEQAVHIQQTASLVYELANKYQVATEAIVLAWLMRHPAKIQPIIGTTHVERIKASAQACNIVLEREDWYALYEKARAAQLP